MAQSKKDSSGSGGKDWEALCQKLLRIKYGHDGYQQINARFKGDLGIEGFTTRTGIVFQCYAPDYELTAIELFKRQKSKVKTDCGKLIKKEKTEEFQSILGETKIREWHFITPKIENKDLLKERPKLIKKIRAAACPHIDGAVFDIQFKTKDDFVLEIARLTSAGEALIAVDAPDVPQKNIEDWMKQNSEHYQILDRKLSKVSNDGSKNKAISSNIRKQIIGDAIMMDILKKYPKEYERIRAAKAAMERDVEERSSTEQLKGDSIDKIRKEFLSRLEKEFGTTIDQNTMLMLAQYTVADWLINCPLDFNV